MVDGQSGGESSFAGEVFCVNGKRTCQLEWTMGRGVQLTWKSEYKKCGDA
jgi:hypothetical protein